jgi:hypothetical protein
LLVVLENGYQRPANRQAGSIKGMNKFRPTRGGSHPRAQAPGLEGLAITARRDLPIRLLTRQPNLDIVGSRSTKSHITGAELQNPIGQL